MKKIVLTLLAAGCVFGVSAQSRIFNNPDNKGYLGVRASLDVTCPSKIKVTDKDDSMSISQSTFGSGAGFGVGVVYNFPLVANLYLEPGVGFYYNTMSIKKDYLDEELDELGIEYKNRSVRQWGMRIPVNFGYHFDFADNFNLAIFTGPVLNVGFSMDQYVKVKMGNLEVKSTGSLYKAEDKDEDDRFNRCNLDWRVGVGANFNNYFIAVSGDIALTNGYHVAKNNSKYYSTSYHQNLFQLTLGYNFK